MFASELGFVSWYRWVLLAATVIIISVITRDIRRVKSSAFTLLALMALLYPVCKTLAMFVIGPRFVRWYLGDFGFVACAGYFGFFLPAVLPLKASPFKMARIGAHAGFRIAVYTELLLIAITPLLKEPRRFAATGDWWDILMYCLSYPIVLRLVRELKNKFEPQAVAPRGKRREKNRQRPR